MTHISNNFDLFVLRLVEDVGVVEDLHERRPRFTVVVEDLDELVELCAPFLKVFGKLLASSLVCNKDTCALKSPVGRHRNARVEAETAGGWRAEVETDTFQLLQVLRIADVDPHGCQLLLPQVHLLQRLLVSGQFIHQCLRLRKRHFLIINYGATNQMLSSI